MDVRVRGRALDHGRSVGGGRKWRQGRPLPPPSAYPVLRARKKNGNRARLGSDLPSWCSCFMGAQLQVAAACPALGTQGSAQPVRLAFPEAIGLNLTCLFSQAKLHADVVMLISASLLCFPSNSIPIYSSRGVPNVVHF
jgi:hypothetical protein